MVQAVTNIRVSRAPGRDVFNDFCGLTGDCERPQPRHPRITASLKISRQALYRFARKGDCPIGVKREFDGSLSVRKERFPCVHNSRSRASGSPGRNQANVLGKRLEVHARQIPRV